MTKREKKALEEKKLHEKMGDKAYAQRTIKKQNDFINSVNLSLKFMFVAFTFSFVICLALLIMSFSILELVIGIGIGVLELADIVLILLWKFKFEKVCKDKIATQQKILNDINMVETERHIKMAEQLKKSKN